jgi:hypothetical protein
VRRATLDALWRVRDRALDAERRAIARARAAVRAVEAQEARLGDVARELERQRDEAPSPTPIAAELADRSRWWSAASARASAARAEQGRAADAALQARAALAARTAAAGQALRARDAVATRRATLERERGRARDDAAEREHEERHGFAASDVARRQRHSTR